MKPRIPPLGPHIPESSGTEPRLPLSRRAGVHHAGRVHPGAHGQRLLLQAGRGPPGPQGVLDPKHGAEASGSKNRRKRRKEKVQQTERSSEDRRADGELLQRHQNAKIQKQTEEEEQKEEKEERKEEKERKEKEERKEELWFANFYSVFCFKTPFSS